MFLTGSDVHRTARWMWSVTTALISIAALLLLHLPPASAASLSFASPAPTTSTTHSYDGFVQLRGSHDVSATGSTPTVAPHQLRSQNLSGISRRVVPPVVAAEGAAGQIDYGSTALSRAVQSTRIAAKDRGGNYAAGSLDDGSTVVGRSSADLHAEQDIIRQAGGRRIMEMFTEREPCAARCAALTQDINVTWSWPWNPPGVRPASNAALRGAVRELFQ